MIIKKAIASFLSVAMLVGTSVVSCADASTETINRVTLNSVGISDAIENKIQITSNGDKIKSGYTLSVSDLEDSDVFANKSNITFYYSSDNENWNEISNAGEAYTITNDMADKYICAVLMDNQAKKYVSNTVQVGKNLKHLLSWGNAVPGAVEKSVDTNKVVFIDENNNKSKELLLLHRDEEKTFFAMPAVSGFNIYDDNTAQTQIISASDPKSIIYKMNQENYITTNIMPISMQKYLRTANWETEAGSSNLDSTRSNMQNDTVTTAKVAPLSASEYYTYGNIIGYNDVNGIMLRTPTSSVTSASAGKFETVLDSGTMQYQNSYSTFYAMVPVFWVSNDIFKEIKAESAGTEVTKAILAAGNENGLYTPDEWNSFQFGDISGTEEIKLDIKSNGGDRIKSGYILTATDKDSSSNIIESAETIAYFTSVDGENWEMAGTAEEGAKFVLLNSHANKYVIAAAKMRDGTKYISNSLLVGENLEYIGKWHEAPTGIKEYADKTNRLYLDEDGLRGIGYTMLDSDEDSVLLLSDSLDNKATYVNPEEPDGLYQIYDSTDENSVAYYINQKEFITKYIVPDGKERFLNTKYWETEAGYADKMTNDTVDCSKVAIPSITELYKYASKIGYRDGDSIRTRSPFNAYKENGNFKILLPSGIIDYTKSTSTFYKLRIETNIDKRMYKQVKLDAINSGIDALAVINLPSMLSIDEAEELGYSNKELIKLGYFKDTKDIIYTSLNDISLDGKDVTIDIAASNPNADIDAKIICAISDSDNRLKFIKNADVTVVHGESNIVKTIEVSNDVAETDNITFYLWKNAQTIFPIAESYTYVVPGTINEYSVLDGKSVRVLGRGIVDNTENSRTFNWPNSGFEFEFTGIVANVYVDASSYDDSVTNGNYFNVCQYESNGQTYVKRIKLKQGWNRIFKGYKKGTYKLALKRSSEASCGTVRISKISTDGEPKATVERAKKIEFIGDSFTTGYANSPELSYSKSFCAQNSDNYNSYTGFVARNYDADYNVIAYGGKGVYLNIVDYDDTMLDQFGYSEVYVKDGNLNMSNREKWNYSDFTPQLVTVFLGENDRNGEVRLSDSNVPTMFYEKYSELLDNIRAAYPNAKVLCISRTNWGYPKLVEKAVADKGGDIAGFYYLNLNNFSASSLGHPTASEDKDIADEIIAKIDTIDGLWD